MNTVLSVAFGGRYQSLLDRLEASLDHVGFSGRRLIWREQLPPGSLQHHREPYGFKPWAFTAAAERGGGRVLWLDAACVARRSLDPLFDEVAHHSVLLFDNPPHNCGQWVSDEALPALGFLNRDQAMTVPHCNAALVGIDLRSCLGTLFLKLWHEHRACGAFFGPWHNRDGAVSTDTRCLGHRHDQSSASALAWHLGIPLVSDEWFVDIKTRAPNEKTVVALDRRRAFG